MAYATHVDTPPPPTFFFSVTQPIRTCHNHLDHVLGSHGPCTPTATSFQGYATHLHPLRQLGEEESQGAERGGSS